MPDLVANNNHYTLQLTNWIHVTRTAIRTAIACIQNTGRGIKYMRHMTEEITHALCSNTPITPKVVNKYIQRQCSIHYSYTLLNSRILCLCKLCMHACAFCVPQLGYTTHVTAVMHMNYYIQCPFTLRPMVLGCRTT